MYRKSLLLISCSLFTILAIAQLKSPEEFLGYKIGSRYTPHWRIVSYYQYVAQALPNIVKLYIKPLLMWRMHYRIALN